MKYYLCSDGSLYKLNSKETILIYDTRPINTPIVNKYKPAIDRLFIADLASYTEITLKDYNKRLKVIRQRAIL